MTEFLKNVNDLFINLSDLERVKAFGIMSLASQYKYCHGKYFFFCSILYNGKNVAQLTDHPDNNDRPNIWIEEDNDDSLITRLANQIEDILGSQLIKCKEQIKVEIDKITSPELKAIKLVLVKEFENSYMKEFKKLTKASYAKSILPFFIHIITDNKFDEKININHQYLLPLKNDNYNFKTGKIEERTEHQFFSKRLNISSKVLRDAVDKKKLKEVDNFFLQISNNDEIKKNYLKKIFGYCLTGDINARAFFIFYGKGANGKSGVIEILQALLNKFCVTVEPSVMIKRGKKNGGSASPEMVALDLGTRVSILSEIDDNDELNETLLKNVSGGDEISYRTLFKDQKTFVSESKCIILTNTKPKCSATQSMIDRTRYVEFNARFTDNPIDGEFKKDPSIIKKLKSELLEYVLLWCIEGTKEYLKDGLLIPKELQNENATFTTFNDSFVRFRNSCLTDDPKFLQSRLSLHAIYTTFCKDEDILKPLTKNQLIEKLTKVYGEPTKIRGDFCFRGFKIQEEENPLDA